MIEKANLTIGLKKSKFCFKELRYLEFIVGGCSLKTDSEKVLAIRKMPIPKFAVFLGLQVGTLVVLSDTLKKSINLP